MTLKVSDTVLGDSGYDSKMGCNLNLQPLNMSDGHPLGSQIQPLFVLQEDEDGSRSELPARLGV